MLKFLKNEKLFSGFRVFYIITVIIYSLSRQNITALQAFLMSDILNVIVILFAGALVCWDVFIFKNIWKTKYISLLIVFTALTVVSSIVGFKYGYIENIKAIANIFIQFFLLYVVSVKKDSNELKKEASIVANAIGGFWAIPVLISLYMYFADITYTAKRYLWGEAAEISQGFVREDDGAVVMRLWGVFVDPNFASAISIAVVALCIFVLLNTKNKLLKVFNVFNIIIQFLYIVLSNSRMALLISCLSAFVGAWYYAYFLFKNKKLNVVVKEILALLVAGVFVVACFFTIQLTKNALPYVRYGIGYVEQKVEESKTQELTTTQPTTAATTEKPTESTTQPVETTQAVTQQETESVLTTQAPTEPVVTTQAPAEPATQQATVAENSTVPHVVETTKQNTIEKLERVDAAVKSDVSNGRFDLWLEGINTVFMSNPIFGVGPRNYNAVAQQLNPDLKIATGYSIHNSFIELLMGNGIVGTLVILLFFILCAIKALKARYKCTDNAKSIGVLMVCVLALFACGMFIACLFYTLSSATIILFTVLGYAVRLTIVDDNNN